MKVPKEGQSSRAEMSTGLGNFLGGFRARFHRKKGDENNDP